MKTEPAKVIVISRDDGLIQRVRKLFPNKKLSISAESEIDKLPDKFSSGTCDVVILTSNVCKDDRMNCIKLLEELTARSPATQVLLLIESADIDMAMDALKAGSFQYTKLPVSDNELKLLIDTALHRKPQSGKTHPLEEKEKVVRFEELVGASNPMQKIYQRIQQAATTEAPVLLLGETGTGKDMAAQAIHRLSARAKGPYIPVNLGALPSDLVASELFGHEKGAFTGAVDQHKGKFEQGNQGTVFLDEIESIDEKVQVSLLRLIEHNKFHRLGGKRPISSDVRLIAASNANVEELVNRGTFREDLFYRLDVFRLVMPALRQRYGDIPLLAEEFLNRFKKSSNKNIVRINSEALQMLEAYDWPGNVRELKNVIQRAVLVCEADEILPDHLPSRFRSAHTGRPSVTFEIGTSLAEVEREMIIRALMIADNNRKRAAELLGISRRAIYNKLQKHNID